MQWRSQPDDLVPLCKFLVIIDCEKQSISKEMNNDVWNFHSRTKLSGWLRHCPLAVFHLNFRIFQLSLHILKKCVN